MTAELPLVDLNIGGGAATLDVDAFFPELEWPADTRRTTLGSTERTLSSRLSRRSRSFDASPLGTRAEEANFRPTSVVDARPSSGRTVSSDPRGGVAYSDRGWCTRS